jgi:hypothetical protein
MKEKNKNNRYLKDLALNSTWKVRKITHECTISKDAEVLIGDVEYPFLARRKYGNGYVYCINSNSNEMPMVIMRNLIK